METARGFCREMFAGGFHPIPLLHLRAARLNFAAMIVARFRLWWWLAVVFCATATPAAVINGQRYTEVADWAKAHGFSYNSRQGNKLVYTNRSTTRLVLEKDSNLIEINGVNVAMCFPAALDRGVMLVSQLDLDKTIEPVLYAPSPRKTITTICLDPGHGGKDTGNRVRSVYWRNEKTYTLALAQELSAQLKKAGFKVILTRTRDVFVDLSARPAYANSRGADLFVSLHFNGVASSQSTVKGIETYCITPVGASSSNAGGQGADHGSTTANRVEERSTLLAYHVQKALVRNLASDDRGVRRARFAVLRDARMPSILVESGYLSHPVEGKKIFDSAYRKRIAASIVQGIQTYQKLTAPVATEKSSGTRRAK